MSSKNVHRVQVVDSHTAGEPTRVVMSGGPGLGRGALAERLKVFRERFDSFRAAIVNEPRGSDVLVGALLTEPLDPSSAAGVIFFNNVGFLGMCGHGTIGLVETLAHLGRIEPGICRIETPVGIVAAELRTDRSVAVENVPSYRWKKDVEVLVPEIGSVRGDIAWGGNWFFLIDAHGQALELRNVEQLTDYCWRVRQALAAQRITGAHGAEIDHIELSAPSQTPGVNSKNFMLCPGKAYDRSPCGTGTSAKLACLAADGKLEEGGEWLQEGILGSVFKGTFKPGANAGEIIPTIYGRAHVIGESTLILNEGDPFCWGIRPV